MFHPSKSGDPQFYVKSGDIGFADRQKSIFDQLNCAEKERSVIRNPLIDELHEATPREMDVDVEPVRGANLNVRAMKRNRSEVRQFRGQESIFKRPDALPPRFQPKSVPDYHKNPHKWVKYSLGDVSQDDMSDRSNSAAAFSFLQEIAARKASAEMDEMDVEQISDKVAFRRPKVKTHIRPTFGSVIEKSDPSSKAEKVKPSFRSSKLVMPEYVVGQKKKKERKKAELITMKDTKSDKTKEIQLGHLMVDDEDDNVGVD